MPTAPLAVMRMRSMLLVPNTKDPLELKFPTPRSLLFPVIAPIPISVINEDDPLY
jgi:hypothetical protein